ncbi:MAG TPA: formate dehydrogenase subunit delta [Methylococcaceae bacterium]|nr:formate dehydrogenase subunit delta [Methylococcaceae bacterium]
MHIEHLITMANQIACFFEGEADRPGAAGAIADHLKRFWDPRMRKAIVAYVDEAQGRGLKEIVVEAIRSNRDRLCSTGAATSPDNHRAAISGVSDAG